MRRNWRPSLTTPSTEESTQGTVTLLFTDLEGSTDLRSRMGDEAADAVFLTHERLTRDVLDHAGALETKYRGDGFLAVFSSARQAIDAAVAIQRAIDAYNEDDPGVPIRVRMGLNSGDVVQRSGEAYGIAIHAASRIADKAQGGQILCSQIVRDLAGSLPRLRIADRGLFWLKGLPARWRLFEVLWREKGTRPRESTSPGAGAESRPSLDLPRSQSPVVGRAETLQAVDEELTAAGRGGLRAVILEGEAGIGKTRVLEATTERASSADPPFWVLSVVADEELRGPFLLFRSLLGDPRVSAIAEESMALEALERARSGLTAGSRDEGLAPQEHMLRIFDGVAEALAALARDRPLALLIDDLQWADEDSVRLIRYLVRTLSSLPIFLLIATRPHSEASTSGAANLIADMERMHVARRIALRRFSRAETASLLETLLEAPVAAETLHSLHARSEGVPFFAQELARAYREAKALQLIDGTWTMTRLSGPTVPASVQSLVARRLAQIPDETRALLADAAVLGRRFRLEDLATVLRGIGVDDSVSVWQLEDRFQEAIDAGIVTRLGEESAFDFAYTHDQMRAALVESIPRLRRREIHGAIAAALAAAGDDQQMPALAYHALHAGDEQLAVSCALRAARANLDAHAPEESIRIIDTTLGAATAPVDRIEMLRVKDEALAVLERGEDRMSNLAEMNALTAAVDDPSVELEVKLRRASAARMTGDLDMAADLARQVRASAVASGDAAMELEACLELGQAITGMPLGEIFIPPVELDPDEALEPFARALEIAREIGDRGKEAACLREMAALEFGRVKHRLMADLDAGQDELQILMTGPERFTAAKELADQAFRIFEEMGDRRGAMSALISAAYAHITDPTPRGMAGRMEQVRRLHFNRKGFVTESQRAIEDAQMLYSIHVFARAHAQPDLAIDRGRKAFEGARSVGDRWLECLAAGGMAMALASIGDDAEAEAWVDRAASAALSVPHPAIARRLETWRGMLCALRGDGQSMVRHLEKAAELAREQGSQAGQCESNTRIAMECARMAVHGGEPWLLERAGQAITDARALLTGLPAGVPWGPITSAAECLVAQAEGRSDDAVAAAREALGILHPRLMRAHYVDVLWAVGRALITAGAPEAEDMTREILEDLWYLDQTIEDPDVKARWFAMPMLRDLVELTGFEPMQESVFLMPDGLEESERSLLALVMAGRSDEEIAARLDTDAAGADRMISALLEKLGLSSRLEATSFAVKAGV